MVNDICLLDKEAEIIVYIYSGYFQKPQPLSRQTAKKKVKKEFYGYT